MIAWSGLSAMSKVTDRLVETGRLAGDRQADQAAQIVSDLLGRHVTVGAFGRNGVFLSGHPSNFASQGLGVCPKVVLAP